MSSIPTLRTSLMARDRVAAGERSSLHRHGRVWLHGHQDKAADGEGPFPVSNEMRLLPWVANGALRRGAGVKRGPQLITWLVRTIAAGTCRDRWPGRAPTKSEKGHDDGGTARAAKPFFS